jgi:alpha-glucosidase
MVAMAQTGTSAFPEGLVIYQIYPRSFQDTNNDGVGDLPGIISRLDYLQSLGITAIWLSPIFPSPMVDFGYDIKDYCAVDPLFGSLADLDHLIAEAHKRHIKILLDLVINHTSDQHPWFQAACSSPHDKQRDWYVWRDPKADGTPPNNWISTFGGSAWELDTASGQYYLHSFFKEQPDLNWSNPAVRHAIKQVMHFWLDRGVDGFRLDAVYWYGKDKLFRDEPANPAYQPDANLPYDAVLHTYSKGDARLYGYLDELAATLAEYHDRFMVMEVYPDDPMHIPSYRKFYDLVNPLVAAPFNFGILSLPWGTKQFETFINAFQKSLKPSDTAVYVSGNHDRPRLASRVGIPATRAGALLQLSLPGVAVIYYGEEIGMQSVPIPPAEIKDRYEKNVPGRSQGRDPERTPMQWSHATHAGFSAARPWLPVASNYQQQNVDVQSKDPESLFNFYKELIRLRQTAEVIQRGSYTPLDLKHADLFAFQRQWEEHTWAIVVNFSRAETLSLPIDGRTILSTVPNPVTGSMKPLEGRILEL